VGHTVGLKRKIALLVVVSLLGVGAAVEVVAPMSRAEQAASFPNKPDDMQWETVAPGRVESLSGEIKIGTPVVARVVDVLVKPNDKVFAGERLIRLDEDEAQARVAAAEAQVALHKRARNDVAASGRAVQRRRAEDAVADADRAVVEARSAVDQATAAKHIAKSDGAIDTARRALARAQNRLTQQQADLRKVEAQANTPLPTQSEGQLNVARAELLAAQAALEKMMIRAPIAGTVLKVNVKVGELAIPSSVQPLVVLGDVSALRVRAQVDEQDFGEIKIGQSVLVRTAVFPESEFAGRVSSIAPIVELGHFNVRGDRNSSDTRIVEVIIDLTVFGQLAVGMKVDAHFHSDSLH
jgi:HlyD family secretion protein